MFKPVDSSIDFPKMERELLDSWYKNGTVKKYLERNNNSDKKFSFLDGPITANNPMGVHHGWGRTYKDLWQRFWNMRGYRERFQNGFDCQGLWVEVEVEKELEIKNKKDIENLVEGNKKESIAKFVDLCKKRVLKYSQVQTEQSKRLGYFMDWDNSYYTMSDENNYAIWNFLKICNEKGWVYKGKDSVPWCPRCETAISQHEMLTEDYKELTHETVFVKLPILSSGWENTYLVIWTTTPWTVPANVAVGINTSYKYGIWEDTATGDKFIIIDEDSEGNTPSRQKKKQTLSVYDYIFQDSGIQEYKKIKSIKGNALLGLKYKAPFDYLERAKQASEQSDKFHTVIDASEVVTETEGTGLLHVAPGSGKEDFDLGKKFGLPIISVINDRAEYLDKLGEFSGKNAKKHPEIIIDFLRDSKEKYLLKSLNYTHRYPACWRCRTELVWKVANEWYIAMDKKDESGKTYREQMIEVANKITWMPEWGLSREMDWLNNLQDWLISKKNRYWGLALPIFECKNCSHFEVLGSREELKKRAVSGWEQFEDKTPHKPYIDDIEIKCSKCGQLVKRIDDVGNVWLDAGIVSISTLPVEWFPADFITESFPGQFKNWFYSLIAMATVVRREVPTKRILGYASVLAEDGRAMHKSWGNSIEFNEGADKIGVDVMRWMYLSNDPEHNLLFGHKHGDEVRRKIILMIWNMYNFFVTYSNIDEFDPDKNLIKSEKVLDTWILSEFNSLVDSVTKSLENYDPKSATEDIEKFISDLSTWYIRRSRDRVGPSSNDVNDKWSCHSTLYSILVDFMRLLAPFMPFVTEEIYMNLKNGQSVHLSDWPNNSEEVDRKLMSQMETARKIVEIGNSIRRDSGIKNRQPLSCMSFKLPEGKLEDKEILGLILEELNIKDISEKALSKNQSTLTKEIDGVQVSIDSEITDELRWEGMARELVRRIQSERKKLGSKLDEYVNVEVEGIPQGFEDYIKKQALIKNLTVGSVLSVTSV